MLNHILSDLNNLEYGVVATNYRVIEYYVNDGYCIYLDTSILLNPALPNFFTHLFPVLVRYHKKVYVTQQTLLELQHYALKHHADWDVFSHVVDIMNLIMNYDLIGIIATDDMDDGCMVETYDVVLATAKERHVLLLTDDAELAGKLKEVCKTRSRKSKVISVMKIDQEGFLDIYED